MTEYNEYRVPVEFENFPPLVILEHKGVYYSFNRTCRSGQSIWDEVKGKLDTLNTCTFDDEDIAYLAAYKV